MPKSLFRLGQYLPIAAMFAACGGHWLVLQSVAWSGMIVEYSRTAKLMVAVEKTFDGQHPCELCKQIQTGRKNEHKRDAQVIVSKLEFFYVAMPKLVLPESEPSLQSVEDSHSAAVSYRVDVQSFGTGSRRQSTRKVLKFFPEFPSFPPGAVYHDEPIGGCRLSRSTSA